MKKVNTKNADGNFIIWRYLSLCSYLLLWTRHLRGSRTPGAPFQVTWLYAKDLFSCCWWTNSQISFYRAKGLYGRPIGGARRCFRVARRTQILLDDFMYRKHYTLKTLALDTALWHLKTGKPLKLSLISVSNCLVNFWRRFVSDICVIFTLFWFWMVWQSQYSLYWGDKCKQLKLFTKLYSYFFLQFNLIYFR